MSGVARAGWSGRRGLPLPTSLTCAAEAQHAVPGIEGLMAHVGAHKAAAAEHHDLGGRSAVVRGLGNRGVGGGSMAGSMAWRSTLSWRARRRRDKVEGRVAAAVHGCARSQTGLLT